MKLKRFKWASPLFIVSLAIAGLFGISSGIIANQKVNEEPVMEKAKASYWGTWTVEFRYQDGTDGSRSMWQNGSGDEAMITGLLILKGEKISIHGVNDSGFNEYFNNIQSNCSNKSKFSTTTVDGHNYLTCNTTGLYDFYFNVESRSIGLWINYTAASSDLPTDRGYYLVGNTDFIGSGTEWKFSSAKKMTLDTSSSNKAYYLNIPIATDSQFKGRMLAKGSDADEWCSSIHINNNCTSYARETSGNIEVYNGGNFKVYWTNSNQVSIALATYTVIWKNGSTTLETDNDVAYGTTPTYNGSTPTKASTAQYTYSFSGWSPTISPVTQDVTYSAQFSETLRSYTITWKNGDTTLETDNNVNYGSTPTYNGSAPTKSSTAQYSYTWAGWTSSGGTDYGKTGLPTVSGNETYTARFTSTPVQYNLTYKYYDVNGDAIDDSTVTSTAYNASVSLPDISITGYRLISWYESDGFGGTARDAGYEFSMPASAKTFTAKCKAVGGYIIGLDDVWTPTFEEPLMIDYGETNYVYKNLSLSEGDKFIVYQVPTTGDDSWHGYTSIDGGDAVDDFQLASEGYEHIECKVTGTYDIVLNASTGKLYVYRKGSGSFAAGYYMLGTGTFAGGTTPTWSFANGIAMSAGTSGNTAQLETVSGTSVAANSIFQVAYHENASSNTWYSMKLGANYDFAEEVAGSKTSIKITKTGNYNFYFKIENSINYIYIVDIGQIDSFGFLYISSNQTAGNITFTSKLADGTSVYSGTLNDISGTTVSTNIASFDGASKLYKIKIYNLRGNQGGALVTQLTWDDGSSKTITGIPTAATNTPHYYGTSGGATTSKGDAARAVYDIAEAIKGSTNKSVCDLSTSASTLLAKCNVTGIDTTLLNAATITTWNSIKPTYSGSKNWSMTDIIAQLNKLNNAGNSAYRGFGLGSIFGDDGNNVTTIIIVVASSIALLSVTALSILVIKKRKHKEQE